MTFLLIIIFSLIAFLFIILIDAVNKTVKLRNETEQKGGKCEYGASYDKEVFNDGNVKKMIYKAQGLAPVEYLLSVNECPECDAFIYSQKSSVSKDLVWECPYCKHQINF